MLGLGLKKEVAGVYSTLQRTEVSALVWEVSLESRLTNLARDSLFFRVLWISLMIFGSASITFSRLSP